MIEKEVKTVRNNAPVNNEKKNPSSHLSDSPSVQPFLKNFTQIHPMQSSSCEANRVLVDWNFYPITF